MGKKVEVTWALDLTKIDQLDQNILHMEVVVGPRGGSPGREELPPKKVYP